MIYKLTAYNTSGDVVYNMVLNTEQQMIEAIQDAMRDDFAVLVCPTQKD